MVEGTLCVGSTGSGQRSMEFNNRVHNLGRSCIITGTSYPCDLHVACHSTCGMNCSESGRCYMYTHTHLTSHYETSFMSFTREKP
jgi:hypothetical protein